MRGESVGQGDELGLEGGLPVMAGEGEGVGDHLVPDDAGGEEGGEGQDPRQVKAGDPVEERREEQQGDQLQEGKVGDLRALVRDPFAGCQQAALGQEAQVDDVVEGLGVGWRRGVERAEVSRQDATEGEEGGREQQRRREDGGVAQQVVCAIQ